MGEGAGFGVVFFFVSGGGRGWGVLFLSNLPQIRCFIFWGGGGGGAVRICCKFVFFWWGVGGRGGE